MKAYDILAIGELLIDCTEDSVGEDGYPILASHPGGAPANFLAAAAKYGARTALFASVGNDAFGHRLIQTVSDAGIDRSFIFSSEDASTTISLVTRDKEGEREFSFMRKPGADTLLQVDQMDLDLLDYIKVLHFGTFAMSAEPSRTTHRVLVGEAKKKGVWISFDPNLRETVWEDLHDAREEMLWGIRQADILKISDTEADFLYGLDPMTAAKTILEKTEVKLVFVTCGKEGAVFANGQALGKTCPAVRVDPIDTTGAGDIFGGSAMSQILRSGKGPDKLSKAELEKITIFACTAASISTTSLGGLISVPEEELVRREIKN